MPHVAKLMIIMKIIHFSITSDTIYDDLYNIIYVCFSIKTSLNYVLLFFNHFSVSIHTVLNTEISTSETFGNYKLFSVV